jgi:Diacylglycerol kinase accessory domain
VEAQIWERKEPFNLELCDVREVLSTWALLMYSQLPSLQTALILGSCIFHRDLRSGHDQMPRIDSVEDLSQVLADDHQRWQHVTACDMPSSCQDGILDIVSVRGAFHLGQIRVGLSSAQRLCQCREATIHIKRKVAVQIDGEPWRQNICTLRVKRKPDRAIMLHKSEDKNGVETEVANLLDWAEKRELIDGNVHYAMMKEFSRRIEHKTRQRRHHENNNLFSLKRAIGSTGAITSSYDGNYEYSS